MPLFLITKKTLGLYEDGDSTFEIYEVASKLDFNTGFLPVFVYGQYAINASAVD
jgi:hypothetical protein